MVQQFGGSVLRDSLFSRVPQQRGAPAGIQPSALDSPFYLKRDFQMTAVGRVSPSIRFTKAAMARILMRASAFNCRRVTTVRKSGRGRLERGDLHGRVGRRGKKRRADLAWRRREDLRLSCVGSPRNDKDPHQRSSQKEHAVCLHAAQIYDRSKRNVSPIEFGVISPLTAARPRHRSGRWR